MKILHSIFGLSVAVLLGACGGGSAPASAPAGPVASTLSFPLKGAYSALVAAGETKSLTVSGTCPGTANVTRAAATGGATFEGVSGRLSAVSTLTMNLTNCSVASIASTSTSYYDTNYTPIGSNTVGGNYGVFLTLPVIPTSVTVGSTAVLGAQTLYTTSTKAVLAGQRIASYVVEPDTANTAIVNFISKEFNASNVLLATEQDRYRISSSGTPVLVSIDVQAANGSTTHLVLQ